MCSPTSGATKAVLLRDPIGLCLGVNLGQNCVLCQHGNVGASCLVAQLLVGVLKARFQETLISKAQKAQPWGPSQKKCCQGPLESSNRP